MNDSDMEYTDLGIMNNWKEHPEEYKNCLEQKHKINSIASSWWSCYTYYDCPICKIRFEVDSSD